MYAALIHWPFRGMVLLSLSPSFREFADLLFIFLLFLALLGVNLHLWEKLLFKKFSFVHVLMVAREELDISRYIQIESEIC